MKKVVLLSLIIFNLFTLNSFGLEENVNIKLSKENPCVEDKIILNFNINSIKDIYGFKVELSYDKTMLNPLATKAKVDELLKNKNYYIPVNNIEEGKIKLIGTLLGTGQNLESKGTLFKVNMEALKEGEAKVNVNTLKLLDIRGNPIKVNYAHNLKNININKNTRKSLKSKSKDVDKQNINIQSQVNIVDKTNGKKIIIHSLGWESFQIFNNYFEITLKESFPLPSPRDIAYSEIIDERGFLLIKAPFPCNNLCLNHSFSVDIHSILLRFTKIL